jgi:hypothetical protein
MRKTVGVASVLVCLAMLAMTSISAQQADDRSHGGRFKRHGDRAIPNYYIVVLDRDVSGRQSEPALNDAQIAALMPDWAGIVTRRFNHALNGFAAYMTEPQAESLADDPRVALVEEDSVMEAVTTQSNPPWGLDRISQRDLPLNHSYTYTITVATFATRRARSRAAPICNGIFRQVRGPDAPATAARCSKVPRQRASTSNH